ncbi:uncharacterized protein LOC144360347 [Saccoglossus kowalevskii]
MESSQSKIEVIVSNVRIALWSTYRSVSTAFLRSVSTLDDVVVIHEPFLDAACFGEDRTIGTVRYSHEPNRPGLTFDSVKAKLEDKYPGRKAVFFKDHAHHIIPRMECLPNTYKHSFLIRQPAKALRSQFIATTTCAQESLNEWSQFRPEESGFRELWQLYNYVKDILGQDPVVVDADDLLNNPKEIMNEYCNKVGLEYKETMVHWDTCTFQDSFFGAHVWFKTLNGSHGFLHPTNDPPGDNVSLPEVVLQSIRDSEPYYQQLYQFRIRGNET